MTTYNTLALDRTAWDLIVDGAGNIGMVSPPYALAQDVASAIKLFLGELWYSAEKGIPYFEQILGKPAPLTVLVAQIENAALGVSGVVTAQCIITSVTDREVVGQLLFTDETGVQNAVNF